MLPQEGSHSALLCTSPIHIHRMARKLVQNSGQARSSKNNNNQVQTEVVNAEHDFNIFILHIHNGQDCFQTSSSRRIQQHKIETKIKVQSTIMIHANYTISRTGSFLRFQMSRNFSFRRLQPGPQQDRRGPDAVTHLYH